MKLQIAPFVLCAKDNQGEEMSSENADTAFVSKFYYDFMIVILKHRIPQSKVLL